MTDTELDEILNRWDAPEAPASLRRRVQAGLTPGSRRWFASTPIGWNGLFAGTTAGVILFLLVIAQALPQSLGLRTGYIIESETVRFAADGSHGLGGHSTKSVRIAVFQVHVLHRSRSIERQCRAASRVCG
jgi:hypothetical protein